MSEHTDIRHKIGDSIRVPYKAMSAIAACILAIGGAFSAHTSLQAKVAELDRASMEQREDLKKMRELLIRIDARTEQLWTEAKRHQRNP